MPEGGLEWTPRSELLSYEEIERVARLCVERLGVDSIRLTGGEPTVRADLDDLVARLAMLDVDLSLTTNGTRLVDLAVPLARAGLRRINVSLDSLRPERFLALTRRDQLDDVVDGIEAALAAARSDPPLDIIAHDFGAAVALALAARHPATVRRLVLVSPLRDATQALRELTTEALAAVLARHTTTAISLRLAAPRIILPEDLSNPSTPLLILDMGAITVSSATVARSLRIVASSVPSARSSGTGGCSAGGKQKQKTKRQQTISSTCKKKLGHQQPELVSLKNNWHIARLMTSGAGGKNTKTTKQN
jgi:hypothetical protein